VVAEVRDDLRRVGVVRSPPHVEVVVVVGEQHVGLNGRGDVIARPHLVVHAHHERVIPLRLVENTIDHEGRGNAGNTLRGLLLTLDGSADRRHEQGDADERGHWKH